MSSMKAEKPEGPGTTLVVLMAKAPAGFTRFASRRNASPPSIEASSAWDPSSMNTSSSPSMATSKPLQNRPYAVFRTSMEIFLPRNLNVTANSTLCSDFSMPEHGHGGESADTERR